MEAKVNGTELFYTTLGQGRPIMFMHGGLGLDHTYFLPWLEPLAENYQLVFYDHRGNGRSERPASYDDITHATWAADADALREHLGFEKMILFGQSYGGFLAQEYALRYSDHLDGLILCDTGAEFGDPSVPLALAQARSTPELFQTLVAGLSNPAADDEGFRKLWTSILPIYFKKFDPEIAKSMDEATSYSGGAYNHSFAKCIPVYNVLAQLDQIQVPTLVLCGREDWITPPQQSEKIHQAISGSELTIFENSGHFPFIEEQELFLKRVRDWLSLLPA